MIVDVYGGPHHLQRRARRCGTGCCRSGRPTRGSSSSRSTTAARRAAAATGSGRSTEVRRGAARRPGGGPQAARREVPGDGPRPRRHRRLVVRRLHGGPGGAASGRTCSRRPSPGPRSPTGTTTTRTTPSATWACCRRTTKAYNEASLLPLAPKLKRPLLLVHGTADDNVYFRHTLRLTDALFRAGKEFEVLPLPGLTHMVARPDRVRALHDAGDRAFSGRTWGRRNDGRVSCAPRGPLIGPSPECNLRHRPRRTRTLLRGQKETGRVAEFSSRPGGILVCFPIPGSGSGDSPCPS